MTTRYSGSCLTACSRFQSLQYTHIQLNTAYSRQYSFTKNASKNKLTQPPPPRFNLTPKSPNEKETALTKTSSSSAVNPPPTTRPPPLDLPTRGKEAYPIHLYRTGRAYGTFYKDGLKNVWHNHKAASALKKRIVAALNARKPDLASPVSASKTWSSFRDGAVQSRVVNRAEFQLLERNARDIGKLPFFGFLVVLFGEWLPLIVPFIPSRVPGTCRIPKQVRGMREKSEARRKWSFRSGVAEPEAGQVAVEGGKWRMTDKANVREVLKSLGPEQLMHLSCVLDQHSGIWDRVQLTPPAGLIRRGVCARVQYLALDDFLIVEAGGIEKLEREELLIACEERGIDVLGKPEEKLRGELQAWIKKQEHDEGRGWAMVEMLFRR
jgi:hypothetical protein